MKTWQKILVAFAVLVPLFYLLYFVLMPCPKCEFLSRMQKLREECHIKSVVYCVQWHDSEYRNDTKPGDFLALYPECELIFQSNFTAESCTELLGS